MSKKVLSNEGRTIIKSLLTKAQQLRSAESSDTAMSAALAGPLRDEIKDEALRWGVDFTTLRDAQSFADVHRALSISQKFRRTMMVKKTTDTIDRLVETLINEEDSQPTGNKLSASDSVSNLESEEAPADGAADKSTENAALDVDTDYSWMRVVADKPGDFTDLHIVSLPGRDGRLKHHVTYMGESNTIDDVPYELLPSAGVTVLMGTAGAGKSTLARKIADAHGALVINPDEPDVGVGQRSDIALFILKSTHETLVVDSIKSALFDAGGNALSGGLSSAFNHWLAHISRLALIKNKRVLLVINPAGVTDDAYPRIEEMVRASATSVISLVSSGARITTRRGRRAWSHFDTTAWSGDLDALLEPQTIHTEGEERSSNAYIEPASVHAVTGSDFITLTGSRI